MKNYLLRASGIAALAVLLFTSVTAQETKNKDKDKEKSNNIGKNDEIVIIKKGDKDAKVVIEVKDGAVTVNGQPLDEYKGDDVIVRRGRNLSGARVYSPSPFSGQAWNYSNEDGEHAYLGVSTEKSDKGARITNVTDNSAAEKAGLKDGDVITKLNETKIEDHDDLSTAIRKHKPEDKVTVTYLRDGKEQKANATLGKTGLALTFSAPNMDNFNQNFNFNDNFGQTFTYNGRPRLGIRAQDTEDGKGVKVLSVDDESPAGKAGIKEDDIITEFDGKEVNSADALANAARGAKDKSSMTVKLNRAGKAQTLEVKIPKKLKTANL